MPKRPVARTHSLSVFSNSTFRPLSFHGETTEGVRRSGVDSTQLRAVQRAKLRNEKFALIRDLFARTRATRTREARRANSRSSMFQRREKNENETQTDVQHPCSATIPCPLIDGSSNTRDDLPKCPRQRNGESRRSERSLVREASSRCIKRGMKGTLRLARNEEETFSPVRGDF